MLVTLLLLSLLYTASPKRLFYKTNVAGLFSQFIQIKLMYDFANHFNRSLVVDSIKCSHYQAPVLINDIFDFGELAIISRKVFSHAVKCYDSVQTLLPLMESNTEDLCYSGPFPYELTGESTPRFGIMQSLGIQVPMRLKKLEKFDKFLDELGINPGVNFTVAHWRRGDQTVRCNSGMDKSVNCGSGAEFVRKVRAFSKDKVVYVATNERKPVNLAPILDAQFQTMGSSRYDELTTLALEVELMLRATTFLAWGVSEIDDVVEFERMKAGKSHCAAYEHYELGRNLTFCYMLKEQHKIPKETFKPYTIATGSV